MDELQPTACARRAFTLIELLVVIAIVALLISIMLPSLGAAREAARQAKCASNLRQFATSSLTYSNDNRTYYCSGPFDNRSRSSYGPIDKAGWITDMIRANAGKPGDMLCQSSVGRANQNLAYSRVNDATAFRTFTQPELDELFRNGYNSNYTQSWYMAYTEMRNNRDTGLDPKRVTGVIGPLSDKYLSMVAPSKVPFFADARSDATDTVNINGHTNLRAVKSVTDGPVILSNTFGRQDYSDFGPSHGKSSFIAFGDKRHDKIHGNFAFADGHVASMSDTNRDGEFGWGAEDPEAGQSPYPDIEGKVFGGHLSSGAFWTQTKE
ncbi:MAG: type II secretion system protein [Phycisphaerae bacterium]|nr:type II secretion system protein [Phycisphaerae bacterium]